LRFVSRNPVMRLHSAGIDLNLVCTGNMGRLELPFPVTSSSISTAKLFNRLRAIS